MVLSSRWAVYGEHYHNLCTGFHQLANYLSVDNLHKDFMDLLLVEQAAASW